MQLEALSITFPTGVEASSGILTGSAPDLCMMRIVAVPGRACQMVCCADLPAGQGRRRRPLNACRPRALGNPRAAGEGKQAPGGGAQVHAKQPREPLRALS